MKMLMTTIIDPEDLASEFCRVLNDWLGADTLQEINRRNALPEYESCCASHDFCDPNQAMLEAMETFGVGFEPDQCGLINAAWDHARIQHFQIDCRRV